MAEYAKGEKPRYCSSCKVRLELNQGKAGYCKPCKSEYDKQRKEVLKKQYHDYLSGIGCEACGEKHPHCLEVHHLFKGAKRYKRGSQSACYNVEDLEMGTAIVLCSCCHSIFHGYFGGKNMSFPDQTKESTVEIINNSRRVFQ
jgi:hypothetical protein